MRPCGRVRRVAVRATATTPDICFTCHRPPEVDCSLCGDHAPGRLTSADSQPACFRCLLARRTDELLTGPDGVILAGLKPLREAIVATDNPEATLSNLGRNRASDLLARIASGQASLSHAKLDEHGDNRSVQHLRALLVSAGALPARDEHLVRLEHFAAKTARGAHPDDQLLLRLFANTHLLRRLRKRLAGADLPANAAYRVRGELTAAARFLAHLRSQGRDLTSCRQADIDACLTKPRQGASTRPFLTWAIRHRHLPPLTIPTPARNEPSQFTPADVRWDLARRILTDDTLDTADRVAACLVLLHHRSLARRLTAIGVDPRPDRNSALLEYARQLPPPVIGKLLGLHPDTTDRWASIAGGKWTRYTPPSPTRGR